MFGKNLVYLRKSQNWTQSDLADKLSIARTTLGDYEREKTEPNLEMLAHLSKLFEVDIDALIRLPLYQPGHLAVNGDRSSRRYINPQSGFLQAIDLVETKAQAGYLESFQDPEYIRELPKIYLPHLPKNEYRGFEIEGDSMLPMESGTIVVGVQVESLSAIRDHRTYIIITKREGMVYKRVRNHQSSQYILASSDNSLFPSFKIDYDSIAEIWQYYAHIGFSDNPALGDHSLADRLEDIQEKVTRLYHQSASTNKKEITY